MLLRCWSAFPVMFEQFRFFFSRTVKGVKSAFSSSQSVSHSQPNVSEPPHFKPMNDTIGILTPTLCDTLTMGFLGSW